MKNVNKCKKKKDILKEKRNNDFFFFFFLTIHSRLFAPIFGVAMSFDSFTVCTIMNK